MESLKVVVDGFMSCHVMGCKKNFQTGLEGNFVYNSAIYG